MIIPIASKDTEQQEILLLAEVQKDADTLEHSLVASCKGKHSTAIWSSNCTQVFTQLFWKT